MLHVAITIYSSVQFCVTKVNFAKDLLRLFVEHCKDLYREEMIIFNMHSLIHLGDDVDNFGPLQNFSAFPFENHLRIIKRLIRKPDQPLQQVIWRLKEKCCIKKTKGQNDMQLKKAHQAGPLPANFPRCEQFKEFHLTNFKLKCSQGNDAVLVNKDIFKIQNVIVVLGL